MNDITAQLKSHASLGASTASRWMACPGSVNLAATLPPQRTTIHAQAGTAAHALAETCLRREQNPHTFVGASFEGVVVDEEMAEAVGMYVDHCRGLMQSCSESHIEKRFNLSALKPPLPMFGTADFVGYNDTGDLYVVDFKYGQGVVVDVDENPQLLYYGLGAALAQEKLSAAGIRRVYLTIVQPRAAHSDGPIRTFTLPFVELLAFAGELLEAARATLAADAPLHAGSHCRWCPASGQCPEQKAYAQWVAQTEFDRLPTNTLPAPGALTTEEFGIILSKLHILEDWASAVRAAAQAKLERGEDVPGWKLVQKRATRKWGNADDVIDWLNAQGFNDQEIMDHKLRSPAQIEKLVGKKNLPQEYVTSESSGVNMVPSSDPREEVRLTVGHEFPALPSGE